ncbi:hypothetical protein BV898_04986 [Hypsibius exemplaris]|uniref:Tudor domain-containing protein n=1 Tax=Hypsibius exemplaris TaxID=2072580 RepID=A0A1W0X0B9_HYPEX|nr:hypothetical protein BV898_04986 [Hypsibius exemplaris]
MAPFRTEYHSAGSISSDKEYGHFGNGHLVNGFTKQEHHSLLSDAAKKQKPVPGSLDLRMAMQSGTNEQDSGLPSSPTYDLNLSQGKLKALPTSASKKAFGKASPAPTSPLAKCSTNGNSHAGTSPHPTSSNGSPVQRAAASDGYSHPGEKSGGSQSEANNCHQENNHFESTTHQNGRSEIGLGLKTLLPVQVDSVALLTPDCVAQGAKHFSFSPTKTLGGLNRDIENFKKMIFDMSFGPLLGTSAFDVVPQHYDSFNSIWIWPIVRRKKDFVEIMEAFTATLKLVTQVVPPFDSTPAIDSSVIAPFEACYYRGLILNNDQNGDCEVLFVDYGNRAIIPYTQLYPIPADSLPALTGKSFPAVALRCKLTGLDYGFRPANAADFDRVFQDLLFSSNAQEKSLSAVINQQFPDVVEIRLCDPWCNDVAQTLLPMGTAVPPANIAARHGPGILPAGHNFDIKIRFIESAHTIYIWPASEEALSRERIKLMSSRMGVKFHACVSMPERGRYVTAFSIADKLFYRAIVLEVFYDSTAKVKFIDFGNVSRLPFDHLCPLDDADVLEFYACALKCRTTWTTVDGKEVIPKISDPQVIKTIYKNTTKVFISNFWVAGEDGPYEEDGFALLEDRADIQVQIPNGVPYDLVEGGKLAVDKSWPADNVSNKKPSLDVAPRVDIGAEVEVKVVEIETTVVINEGANVQPADGGGITTAAATTEAETSDV